MKTNDLYLNAGRRITFWICIVVTNAIVALCLRLLAQTIKPFIIDMPTVLRLITISGLFLIPNIVLTLILFTTAVAVGYDKKVGAYWEKRLQKRKEEYRKKMEEAQKNYKTLVQETKEMYSISDIVLGEQIFSVVLTLNETIYVPSPPTIKANGTKIGSDVKGSNIVYCYFRKILTAETRTLVFSIGNNFVEINNPYYMPSHTTAPIKWQCKGHNYERRIFLPLNYFPNVVRGCEYEFTLKINRVDFGTVTGKYDPETYCIVIPLGKDVNPSDCVGKEVALHVTFGKGNKIVLPPPIVMTVEGMPV
jgi:hypothetical protein